MAGEPWGRLKFRGRTRPARVTGLVIAAGVGWIVMGPLGSTLATSVVVAAPAISSRRRRSRDRRRLDADIALIFELAARSVRSGTAPTDAVVGATRSAPDPAAHVVIAMMRTSSTSDGISGSGRGGRRRGFTRRGADSSGGTGTDAVSPSTVDVVAAVVGMVRGAAGGGARALEAGAVVLREHDRARAEVVAAASHARASAQLLVAVPMIFGGASLLVLPASATGMLSQPAVLASVLVGVCLELLGAIWTSRLVRATNGGAP